MKDKKRILPRIIFTCAILSTLYCFCSNLIKNEQSSIFGFWAIPAFYTVLLFLSIFLCKDNTKFFAKTVLIVTFVKYVLTILLYYIEGAPKIDYELKVIALQGIEMMSIFLLVIVLMGKNRKKKNAIKKIELEKVDEKKQDKFLGVSAVIGILYFITILIRHPEQLVKIFIVKSGTESTITGFDTIVFKATLVIFLVFLLRLIRDKMKINETKKIIISLLIVIFFIVNSAASLEGNISRWNVLYGIIGFSSILWGYYQEKRKTIIKIAIIALVILLPVMTFLKFGDSESQQNISVSSVSEDSSERISFKSFDSYFSGPYQTAMGIKTKEVFGKRISFKTLLNDTFANFPLLNHYFEEKNTLTTYYNVTMYGDWDRRDHIIPISCCGYIYFGTLFSSVFTVIFIYLAYIADRRCQNVEDEIGKYMYNRTIFCLATCIILNYQIVFQFIWQTFLPLFLIRKVNLKISSRGGR